VVAVDVEQSEIMLDWKLSLVYDFSVWMITPPDSSTWIKLLIPGFSEEQSFITQLLSSIEGLVSLLINRGWF
jgi:hypothetical protein